MKKGNHSDIRWVWRQVAGLLLLLSSWSAFAAGPVPYRPRVAESIYHGPAKGCACVQRAVPLYEGSGRELAAFTLSDRNVAARSFVPVFRNAARGDPSDRATTLRHLSEPESIELNSQPRISHAEVLNQLSARLRGTIQKDSVASMLQPPLKRMLDRLGNSSSHAVWNSTMFKVGHGLASDEYMSNTAASRMDALLDLRRGADPSIETVVAGVWHERAQFVIPEESFGRVFSPKISQIIEMAKRTPHVTVFALGGASQTGEWATNVGLSALRAIELAEPVKAALKNANVNNVTVVPIPVFSFQSKVRGPLADVLTSSGGGMADGAAGVQDNWHNRVNQYSLLVATTKPDVVTLEWLNVLLGRAWRRA